jgi:hypothetical protein
MSQIEITQVIEQIQEEIEVDELGRGKASVRATARLAGVDEKAIRNTLDTVRSLIFTLGGGIMSYTA